MMSPVKEEMLVMVSATDNNNKFYHVTLDNNGVITKRWGRVGSDGTKSTESGNESSFNRIVQSKTRKGYKPTEIVGSTTQKNSQTQNELSTIAKKVLTTRQGNPELEKLIDKLVAINKHEIIETSGGLIKINQDGVITTPLGLVSENSIVKAEDILHKIQAKKNKDIGLLEEYLTIIPQKVPARRGWQDTFFKETEDYTKQYEFLKQLKDSIAWQKTAVKAAQASDDSENIEEKYKTLFKSHIDVLDNVKEFKRIEKLFQATTSSVHRSSRLKLKKVYVLTNETEEELFNQKAKDLGNVQELWHGTRAFNVLSILRKGLFVPPTSGGTYQITGRMFGNGVYLSDQSSKALNYSNGYWSGARENNCYMFLTDTIMGNEYRPRSRFDARVAAGSDTHGKPYNSTNVKGGTCGVINNEMIVPNADQIKLKYLCEFDI
jgi:poly [ADP-ribose] polymerase